MDFFKYNSNGNDFIIIDDRKDSFIKSFDKKEDINKYIQKLCSRQFYIGADGLVLLQKSKVADFKMLIFNSDGFEASMCGNALLCLAKFISDFIEKRKKISIETKANIYQTSLEDDFISFFSKKPKILKSDYKIQIDASIFNFQILNSGVFHGVTFLDDLKNFDVFNIGKKIRYLKDFAPIGINVNFCEILSTNEIKVRTYEKGVEDETYCCLTGAIAVCHSYKKLKDIDKLFLHFKGGEVLANFQNNFLKLTSKPSFAYQGKTSFFE